MEQILEAIQAGASGDELANLAIPDHYRAAFVRREDADMFAGMESAEKDPTKSLHIGDVATPELAPDEAYVAVMASSINFNSVDDQDPSAHDDSMLATNQRIWGFETNFGGLADLTVVKANQLMPKPAHLSWEESAVNALCNSTSYRMLVSQHAADLTQGE